MCFKLSTNARNKLYKILNMEYSTLTKNARDIDQKKGIISFYFADFNSVDSHGRRMSRNAFNRTFKNNFQRMVHLFNHDPNTIIGKPLEIGKDENGAFMVSQLMPTEKGREVLTLYENAVLNEHSFGFVIKDSIKDGKIEIVNELQMFEASTVTWGANENTPVIGLNSYETKMLKIEKDIEEIKNAIMALGPAQKHSDPQTSDIDINNLINEIENFTL